MAVPTYTFRVELIGSRNSAISRTFTIPASWSFYRLHAAIQYTLGWLDCHLHQWTFEPARMPPTNADISLGHREKLMAIHMGTPEDEDDDWGQRRVSVSEKRTSDNWDHKIALIRKTVLESKKLKVVEVKGAAPLGDSGGLHGWDEVKRVFASTNVTDEFNSKEESRGGVDELNTASGYQEWLGKAAQGSGDYYDPDDIQESEGENRPALDISSLPEMPFPETLSANFGPRIIYTPAARRFVTREGTHPLDLFTPALNACTARAPHFVHTDNTRMASVLIFLDGVAINEGRACGIRGCITIHRRGGFHAHWRTSVDTHGRRTELSYALQVRSGQAKGCDE
ncbi:hypothetical protein BS17DRAFT_767313 [Gyrodon lividus]|nr:hypothetical protein BS17DRAFT_767313 [Gyrodon lividus]